MMKKICAASGFDIIPFEEQADIYVINTCTVTGNADKKSRHAIRMVKKNNAKSTVIATGCYVETKSFNMKEADLILHNEDKLNIDKFIRDERPASRQGGREMRDAKNISSPISHLASRVRSNLMIENGCENFCSYCIVPFVRGKIISKPVDQVISEAKSMVKDGVKEIVLTGINLGEYKTDIPSRVSHLASLIDELSKIDGLLRIRLSSIEPMYITDDLIKVVKEDPKVCKHLHIPLQSGDDKILKAMNRNYTSKDFLDMTKKIREQIKDIAITTDIIIGFPGEDDKAFKNTCGLADKARFSRIHIFSYSDRPGTAASKLPDKIDPKTIAKRHEKLGEIRDKLMLKFHSSFIKRPVEVLIEQKDRKTGMYEGLSSGFIRVFLAGLPRSPLRIEASRRGDDMGDECLGRLIPVKFKEFQGENVIARLR